jgi:predicted ATPase
VALDNSEAVRNLLSTDTQDGEQGQLEKCIVVQFDTLNPQQQEILKVAAIIGTLFRASVLKKVLPMSFCRNHDFNGEMEALEEQRILYSTGDDMYSFNHDLSRTVIASLVPTTKQSKLHNQSAKAYERLFRDDLRPYYSRLAYHYDKCGEAEESFTYLKLAAISALQIDSIQKAIDMLNRAMIVISNSKLTSSDRTVKAEQLILLLRSSLRDAGVPIDATGSTREV